MYNVNAYSSKVRYFEDDPDYPRRYSLDYAAMFSILEADAAGVAHKYPLYRGIRCRDALDYIFSHMAATGEVVPCAEDEDREVFFIHGYNYPRADVADGAKVRLTTDNGKSFLLFSSPEGPITRKYFERMFKEQAAPVFELTGIEVPKLHYSPRNSREGSHWAYVVEFDSIYTKATFGLSFLTQLVRGCTEGSAEGDHTAYRYWAENEDPCMEQPTENVSVVRYLAPYIRKCLEIAEEYNVTDATYNEDSLDYGVNRLMWRVYADDETIADDVGTEISYTEVVNFLRKKLSN